MSAIPATLNATSISPVPWDEVVDRADYIALVRVQGVDVASAAARCKFRVRVEPLEVYRGTALLEFHVDEMMVVGARYLVIGDVSDGCGPGTTEISSEYFPSSYRTRFFRTDSRFPSIVLGWRLARTKSHFRMALTCRRVAARA